MLEELGDVLDVDFSEEDADTVNGFVISRLGRLPSEEETDYPIVTEYGYSFEICKVNGKQISIVSVIHMTSMGTDILVINFRMVKPRIAALMICQQIMME